MSYRAISEQKHRGVYCVVIRAQCESCKAIETLYIPEVQWLRWQGGELIQRAIPALSKQDRELLISGTCGKCFAAMFQEAAS